MYPCPKILIYLNHMQNITLSSFSRCNTISITCTRTFFNFTPLWSRSETAFSQSGKSSSLSCISRRLPSTQTTWTTFPVSNNRTRKICRWSINQLNDLEETPFDHLLSTSAALHAQKCLQKVEQPSPISFRQHLENYRLKALTPMTLTYTPEKSFFYTYTQSNLQELPSHTFLRHNLTTPFHNHEIATGSVEQPDFYSPKHHFSYYTRILL